MRFSLWSIMSNFGVIGSKEKKFYEFSHHTCIARKKNFCLKSFYFQNKAMFRLEGSERNGPKNANFGVAFPIPGCVQTYQERVHTWWDRNGILGTARNGARTLGIAAEWPAIPQKLFTLEAPGSERKSAEISIFSASEWICVPGRW